MEEETSNPKDLFENMNSDNLNEEQTDDDQGQFINSCLPNSGADCNSFRYEIRMLTLLASQGL